MKRWGWRYGFSVLLVGCLLYFAVPQSAQETDDATQPPETPGDIIDNCFDPLGCVILGPDDPVRIATILALSQSGFYGRETQGAVNVALTERNFQVLGRDIEIVEADSACNEDDGIRAAETIVAQENIVAIIGTNCSSAAVGALPIISQAGLLMISPSNTMPQLTQPPEETPGDGELPGLYQPGYFRTVFSDDYLGFFGAGFIANQLGASTLATVNDGTGYSLALARAMEEQFRRLGGDVVASLTISPGQTDFQVVLNEIAAAAPDVLFMPLWSPETGLLANRIIDKDGLAETLLIITDTAGDEFTTQAEKGAQGVYMLTTYLAGEAYDAFTEQYIDINGFAPPSEFHAHAYDATLLLLDTIERAAESLDENTVVIGRQALRDALTLTENYAGLTGRLSCTETGDCASTSALGAFVLLGDRHGMWSQQIVYTPSR